MDAAWADGIRWFDTADAYGGGRSESFIGRWRADRQPDGLLVTTKVFNPVTGDPDDRGLAPERIRRSVEGSLERLGVDRIDLYLAHDPDPETPLAETRSARSRSWSPRARSRRGGSATTTPPGSRRRSRHGRPGGRPELVLAARPRRRGGGAAALRRARDRLRPVRPARRRLADRPLRARRRLPRGLAHDDAARAVPAPRSTTASSTASTGSRPRRRSAASSMAALAFAWVLSHPHVTAAVCGPSRPAHLEPVVAALDVAALARRARPHRLVLRMTVRDPQRARRPAPAADGRVHRRDGRGARGARARRALQPAALGRAPARASRRSWG